MQKTSIDTRGEPATTVFPIFSRLSFIPADKSSVHNSFKKFPLTVDGGYSVTYIRDKCLVNMQRTNDRGVPSSNRCIFNVAPMPQAQGTPRGKGAERM